MKLNYRVEGEGTPMIILHGLFGALDNWLSLAKIFAKGGKKVYLVDQRNHGKSPHSEEHHYHAMADDLNEFIEDHQIEQPLIVGHSMGGKTLMRFSVKYPEKLSKMIIVDIAPRYYPIHHRTIIDGLKAVKVETVKTRREAEKRLEPFVKELGLRQFLLKNMVRTGDHYAWKVNLSVIDQEIENIGEALPIKAVCNVPVLFLSGGASDYVKEEDHSHILKHFPNASFKVLEGAGHWLHAEKPQETISIIEDYFS
ncbi:MAG: alpha/beta fold hydrolase [Cytophagales bacterium]|nr:alpha/beta fold hydrolase [Cytophagales bacterium]